MYISKKFSCIFILMFFSLTFNDPKAQSVNPQTLSPNQCKIKDNNIIVPNLLGFNPDKAQEIAEACDLVWSFSNSPGTISYEAMGTIGDQEPSAGTVVKAGSTLRGFKSNGIYVPNLIGLNEADATFLVKNQRFGLNVNYKRVPGPVGTVIEQSPKNGDFFNSGVPVTITVVQGFKLPTLLGRPYNEVVDDIQALGLSHSHLGGDLSSGWQATVPPCEGEKWFPVIKNSEPQQGATVSEGTVIGLVTERKTVPTFTKPTGAICR